MWRFFLMAWLASSPSGCRGRGEAAIYGCECSFLTDTDDASTQRVELCETSPERATSAARGCAQSGAPATVQACTCTRSERSGCHVGDCAVSEHR